MRYLRSLEVYEQEAFQNIVVEHQVDIEVAHIRVDMLLTCDKGIPTVAIGIYLRVLYALQLDDDILWLAKEDKLGKALQDLSLKTRRRASKKE